MEKNKVKVNKIEVDERTNEAKIVEEEITINATKLVESENEKEQKVFMPSSGVQLNMSMFEKEEDQITKRQLKLKRLLIVLFWVVVVGVLLYTFYKDFCKQGSSLPQWSKVKSTIKSCWFYGVFAVVAFLMCYLTKGLKLSILAKKMTGKWHLGTCIKTGIIGIYYNYVTPLAVGGQPFEIYYLSKHGVQGGISAAVPIATYFLHQIGFVVLGITALILFRTNALLTKEYFSELTVSINVFYVLAWVGLGFGLLMPTGVLVFCLMPKFGGKVVGFIMNLGAKFRIVKDPVGTTNKTVESLNQNAQCLKDIVKAPISFLLTFLLSLGEHLALCSIAYFTLRFFGYDIPLGGIMEWLQVVALCLILYSAVSFIPTPGNAGAADFSFFTLFQTSLLAGFSFSAMVVWRFLSFYLFIIVGFIVLRTSKKRHKDEWYNK